MSSFTFISSNSPLEDVENPHIKLFSINEALENGIVAHESLPASGQIDRNKPGVILWIDDEENFGEITIRAFSKTPYESCLTNMEYCSALEWGYSDERAKQLIAYIRKHLEVSDMMEIWHVWLGDNARTTVPKKHFIHMNDLMPNDLKKMLKHDSYEFPECIIVVRDKPL